MTDLVLASRFARLVRACAAQHACHRVLVPLVTGVLIHGVLVEARQTDACLPRCYPGHIYYIAYRWDGREYRESARSSQRGVAERLLATRLRERRGSPPPAALTFDALAAWYLDDYGVRRLRTLDTARGRVANLRAVFGGWPATAITTEAIRSYQRRRRTAGAAAATVNRETSALSRMFQLAVRSRQLAERPVFPERLEENGPRQGFFEHAEYVAVRQYLPAPYQDVLDFAYYSGWRKREILDLRWDEVDEAGEVVRLSPHRSKTRVGRGGGSAW